MSIIVPASPNLLPISALMFRPLAIEPLHAILRNTNWLYANHSPALVNLALHGLPAASQEFVFKMPASADALDYTALVHTYNGTTSTVTAEVFADPTSTAPGAGWGAAIMTDSTTRLGRSWYTLTGTIPAGTAYGRLTVAAAAGTIQAHAVLIYPTAVADLAVFTGGLEMPSGFRPYNDDALNAADGAIHREYLDRASRAVKRVLQDRQQQVFGYAVETSTALRITSTAGAVQVLCGAPAHIPGQAGCSLTVGGRFGETGGGSAVVKFGLVGGANVALACDGTDDLADPLLCATDRPNLLATAWFTGASTIQPYYLQAFWKPGD